MGWPTAQTVVMQAALELGLGSSVSDWGADVFQWVDPNAAQLTALLKRVGRDIVDEAPWSHLRKQHSFKLSQQVGLYQLPLDWRDMIDQSGWNRSTRLPLGGPLSDQSWEFLNARLTGVVFNVLFRPMQGLLQVYPPATPTPSNQIITLSYKSAWWVLPLQAPAATIIWSRSTNYLFGTVVQTFAPGSTGPNGYHILLLQCSQGGTSASTGSSPLSNATGPTDYANGSPIVDGTCLWNVLGFTFDQPTLAGGTTQNVASFGLTDASTAGTDTLLFDEQLLVAGLKAAWLDARGFDSSSAEDDYNERLAAAVGNDQAAPILDLSRGGVKLDVLLSQANLPITGYGGTS